jgi:hypothetical protein
MNAKTLTALIAGLSLLPLAACEKEKETTTRITEAPPPTVIVNPPAEKAEPAPPPTINVNPPPAAPEPPPANAPEAPKSTQ